VPVDKQNLLRMVLVSGATGFIGTRLLDALVSNGVSVRGMARQAQAGIDVVADLDDSAALLAACAGVSTVFHCAGYAHAFSSLSGDDAAIHWRVNFEGTRNLVEAAGQAGVRRFVFLSSVKAMAEPGNDCAAEDFAGDPETAYGQSKLAAEKAVLAAGQRYGMHVVNLRLAMVYGAGGRGNLERMGRLVKRGWFPPLPETGNHRSLVHVDDVVSAMRLVAEDDRASGKTYVVASHEAPSGRALFNALRAAQGLASCAWTVPVSLLRFAANLGDGLERLLQRRLPLDTEALDRLLGSAWYSPAYIERDLGWRAKVSLHDGLSEMMKK
jgi:nucleoside-diphosphate-sugar epimerase